MWAIQKNKGIEIEIKGLKTIPDPSKQMHSRKICMHEFHKLKKKKKKKPVDVRSLKGTGVLASSLMISHSIFYKLLMIIYTI